MELARHYEQLLSATREGSDIWNINHSGGSWVNVDQDTLSVLELALDFAQFSEGAVDPTIGGSGISARKIRGLSPKKRRSRGSLPMWIIMPLRSGKGR